MKASLHNVIRPPVIVPRLSGTAPASLHILLGLVNTIFKQYELKIQYKACTDAVKNQLFKTVKILAEVERLRISLQILQQKLESCKADSVLLGPSNDADDFEEEIQKVQADLDRSQAQHSQEKAILTAWQADNPLYMDHNTKLILS